MALKKEERRERRWLGGRAGALAKVVGGREGGDEDWRISGGVCWRGLQISEGGGAGDIVGKTVNRNYDEDDRVVIVVVWEKSGGRIWQLPLAPKIGEIAWF